VGGQIAGEVFGRHFEMNLIALLFFMVPSPFNYIVNIASYYENNVKKM